MAVSKIEYFGETLIDLTNDTVSADTILAGYTAHGKDGEPITGTLEVEDVTEETTAYTTKLGTQDTIIEQIVTALQNKTAAEVKEEQEKTVTPTSSIQEVVPDEGKTLSKVTVNAVPTENKTITPSKSTQTITPTSGKFLSQVTVNGDSDLVAENIKKDVEIFGVTGTYEGSGSSSDVLKELITRTITSIDLPNDLTIIGEAVFYGCTNLALTSLPSSITSIGGSAFYNCKNLALTSLPDSITSIAAQAFNSCSNLALTSLPSGITSIESGAFGNCSNLALTSLPDSIVTISYNAFYRDTALPLTSLPTSLENIYSSAFNGCSNLALTSLPSGIKEIGSSAFYNCTGLTSITFKGKPTTISSSAFQNCTNLKTINVPWASGAVANAPWGATNATINYNYTG